MFEQGAASGAVGWPGSIDRQLIKDLIFKQLLSQGSNWFLYVNGLSANICNTYVAVNNTV